MSKGNKNLQSIQHPIAPVYDAQSEILILGSFPSVKSREEGFFYGHPQNRFWSVLAAICDDVRPQTVAEKRQFLLEHHIAVWDVIASCEIEGSADSSIQNVVPNDIVPLLENSRIEKIFTNGKTAHRLYQTYIEKQTGRQAVCLPSTSPANARWTLELLVQEWKEQMEK